MYAAQDSQSQFMHLHRKLQGQGHLGQPTQDAPQPTQIINPNWGNQVQYPAHHQPQHMMEHRHERPINYGLSRSYDGFRAQYVSSQVDLSAKFQRQRLVQNMSFQREEPKRANTLDARGIYHGDYQGYELYMKNGVQQDGAASRKRWRQNTEEVIAQQPPQVLPMSTNDCIKEEVEQSQSSRTSQAQISSNLTPELLSSLDFSFFRNVYSAYNTIWQQVMRLQIFGQNFVRRDDFIRVLKSCKVLHEDNCNVFCNFLLFSCSSNLKQARGARDVHTSQPMLFMDFRLFLKSIFMTLKRQFNEETAAKEGKTIDSLDQERVFHSEMFLVDHFWEYVCQTEQLKQLPETHTQSKDSSAAMNRGLHLEGQTDRMSVDALSMDLLQKKLFQFFDRREPPFLLQISEIELMVTECFKNLIERRKRKDKISKRTFKKVISRQCPGVLVRAFCAFIPETTSISQTIQDQKGHIQKLQPFSIPLSGTDTARTGLNTSGAQHQAYGNVVDHHMPSNRHKLHPMSLPRSTMNTTGNSFEIRKEIHETCTGESLRARDRLSSQDMANSYLSSLPIDRGPALSAPETNRDQKSINEHHQTADQTEQQPEKLTEQRRQKPQSKSQNRGERNTLTKQLETKIVVTKLQSVLNSFKTRLAFIVLREDPNPLVDIGSTLDHESSETEEKMLLVKHEHQSFSKSSEEVEVPLDKTPQRPSSLREHYIISVQKPQKTSAQQQFKTDSAQILYQQQNQMALQNRQRASQSSLGGHEAKQTQHRDNKQKQKRRGVRDTYSNVMTAANSQYETGSQGNSHLQMYKVHEPAGHSIKKDGVQSEAFYDRDYETGRNESGEDLSYNLQSYHDQGQNARVLSLGAPISMENSGQVISIDSNYRTSCFQGQPVTGVDERQDKRFGPRSPSLQNNHERPDSPKSDQKLQPFGAQAASDASSSKDMQQQRDLRTGTTHRSDTVTTVEMLKHILQHESENQQCLQELLLRIQQLEVSSASKTNSREQTFQQVQNLHLLRQHTDFSVSSNSQIDQQTPGHFPLSAHESGYRQKQIQDEALSSDQYFCRQPQQMYDNDTMPLIQGDKSNQMRASSLASDSRSSSQCSRRAHLINMMQNQGCQYQLDFSAQHEKTIGIANQNNQILHNQHKQLYEARANQQIMADQTPTIGQQQLSQDADLCGSVAEGYCHEQFYEVSKDEDHIRQGGVVGAYDDYGDEMDFEANKEQRPLQISQLKDQTSMPEFSGDSSLTDSRNAATKTISNSDAFVNSTQPPMSANQYYNATTLSQNPYLMTTTNSNSRSVATRHRLFGALTSQNNSNKIIGVHQQNQVASLSYTISDQRLEHSSRNSPGSKNQITSAPNLQVASMGLQSDQEMIPEKPYSNRIQDQNEEQQFTLLNYLSSRRDDDLLERNNQTISSAQNVPETRVVEMPAPQALPGDQNMQRKYKKMKRHVKSMLQEKQQLEERVETAVKDAQVLQNHLEKTAQSAQEVSNRNEELQHELRMRKLFFAVRTLVRIRSANLISARGERLRRAFLRWNLQTEKLAFLTEQTQHQELILSELSRHEHDFKNQIGDYEERLTTQRSRSQFVALKQVFRNQARLARVKAFSHWKSACCAMHSSRTQNKVADLKEDLKQVVTQLNHFRVELVLTKLKAALKRSVSDVLGFTLGSLREYPGRLHNKVSPFERPPQRAPLVYKSPFMQHLQ